MSHAVSTKTFYLLQAKQQKTCMFSSLTHSSKAFYSLWPPLADWLHDRLLFLLFDLVELLL